MCIHAHTMFDMVEWLLLFDMVIVNCCTPLFCFQTGLPTPSQALWRDVSRFVLEPDNPPSRKTRHNLY